MNTFILLISFSCLFLISPLSAKEIHLLVLGDTIDQEIGFSTRKNLLNIKKTFSHIAKISNLLLYTTEFTSTNDTLKQSLILNWIRNTRISSDDIVILYYSGHGWRKQDSATIWPSGNFYNANKENNFSDFSEIAGQLFSKKASFYLILLDCCNCISKSITVENQPLYTVELDKLFEKSNATSISKLFQKFHGFVIASAASPSEVGWSRQPLNEASIDTSRTAGSIFTNFFLNKFFYELQEPKPQWSNILKNTQLHCSEETKKELYKLSDEIMKFYNPPHTHQTPQYRVFLHKKRRKPDTYRRYLFEKCRYKGVQAKECSESDEFDIALDHSSNELPKYLILSAEK